MLCRLISKWAFLSSFLLIRYRKWCSRDVVRSSCLHCWQLVSISTWHSSRCNILPPVDPIGSKWEPYNDGKGRHWLIVHDTWKAKLLSHRQASMKQWSDEHWVSGYANGIYSMLAGHFPLEQESFVALSDRRTAVGTVVIDVWYLECGCSRLFWLKNIHVWGWNRRRS